MSAKREWTVQADEEGNVDPQELAEMMLKIGTVLEMAGGTVVIGARRVEVGLYNDGGDLVDTRWQADEIVAQWDSFAPGRKLDRSEPDERERPPDFGTWVEPVDGEPVDEPETMRDEDEATVEQALEEEEHLEPALTED